MSLSHGSVCQLISTGWPAKFCVIMLINTMPYNFQDKPMKDQPKIGRKAGYSC
jgi:hypothetical protein